MNKNLELLDKTDKKENIYSIIVILSKKIHEILSGAPIKVKANEDYNLIDIIIEEFLQEKDKNE